MRYRLQRHDGTDCSATMVPITVLRMVPIQRYRHRYLPSVENRIFLGYFTNGKEAVREAKKHYSNVDGCFFCCPEAHTR